MTKKFEKDKTQFRKLKKDTKLLSYFPFYDIFHDCKLGVSEFKNIEL